MEIEATVEAAVFRLQTENQTLKQENADLKSKLDKLLVALAVSQRGEEREKKSEGGCVSVRTPTRPADVRCVHRDIVSA